LASLCTAATSQQQIIFTENWNEDFFSSTSTGFVLINRLCIDSFWIKGIINSDCLPWTPSDGGLASSINPTSPRSPRPIAPPPPPPAWTDTTQHYHVRKCFAVPAQRPPPSLRRNNFVYVHWFESRCLCWCVVVVAVVRCGER